MRGGTRAGRGAQHSGDDACARRDQRRGEPDLGPMLSIKSMAPKEEASMAELLAPPQGMQRAGAHASPSSKRRSPAAPSSLQGPPEARSSMRRSYPALSTSELSSLHEQHSMLPMVHSSRDVPTRRSSVPDHSAGATARTMSTSQSWASPQLSPSVVSLGAASSSSSSSKAGASPRTSLPSPGGSAGRRASSTNGQPHASSRQSPPVANPPPVTRRLGAGAVDSPAAPRALSGDNSHSHSRLPGTSSSSPTAPLDLGISGRRYAAPPVGEPPAVRGARVSADGSGSAATHAPGASSLVKRASHDGSGAAAVPARGSLLPSVALSRAAGAAAAAQRGAAISRGITSIAEEDRASAAAAAAAAGPLSRAAAAVAPHPPLQVQGQGAPLRPLSRQMSESALHSMVAAGPRSADRKQPSSQLAGRPSPHAFPSSLLAPPEGSSSPAQHQSSVAAAVAALRPLPHTLKRPVAHTQAEVAARAAAQQQHDERPRAVDLLLPRAKSLSFSGFVAALASTSPGHLVANAGGSAAAAAAAPKDCPPPAIVAFGDKPLLRARPAAELPKPAAAAAAASVGPAHADKPGTLNATAPPNTTPARAAAAPAALPKPAAPSIPKPASASGAPGTRVAGAHSRASPASVLDAGHAMESGTSRGTTAESDTDSAEAPAPMRVGGGGGAAGAQSTTGADEANNEGPSTADDDDNDDGEDGGPAVFNLVLDISALTSDAPLVLSLVAGGGGGGASARAGSPGAVARPLSVPDVPGSSIAGTAAATADEAAPTAMPAEVSSASSAAAPRRKWSESEAAEQEQERLAGRGVEGTSAAASVTAPADRALAPPSETSASSAFTAALAAAVPHVSAALALSDSDSSSDGGYSDDEDASTVSYSSAGSDGEGDGGGGRAKGWQRDSPGMAGKASSLTRTDGRPRSPASPSQVSQAAAVPDEAPATVAREPRPFSIPSALSATPAAATSPVPKAAEQAPAPAPAPALKAAEPVPAPAASAPLPPSASPSLAPPPADDVTVGGMRVLGGKYIVERVVGEGSYGSVMKCRVKGAEAADGRPTWVAVKTYKAEKGTAKELEDVARNSVRELAMLRVLQHPNVVGFIDELHLKGGGLQIVMEFLPANLLELLESSPRGMSRSAVRLVVRQLCSALAFMHSKGVMYRDLKPENLLVGEDGSVKFCDFGFARYFNKPGEALTDYVATRWYRSPELLLGPPFREPESGKRVQYMYGAEVDMWAVGCIMGELFDGEPVFPGESDLDQMYKILTMMGPLVPEQQAIFKANPMNAGIYFNSRNRRSLAERYNGKMSGVELDFLTRILDMDPAKRLTSEQALSHPYLAEAVRAPSFSPSPSVAPAAPLPKPVAAAAPTPVRALLPPPDKTGEARTVADKASGPFSRAGDDDGDDDDDGYSSDDAASVGGEADDGEELEKGAAGGEGGLLAASAWAQQQAMGRRVTGALRESLMQLGGPVGSLGA
ncbi:hypothetical protein FOA52_006054 [Chlamydomonas sp. UWO 241]|nr:hypothetical protein FOA52_006054 [Chlamydomonas sp. UWO 241]